MAPALGRSWLHPLPALGVCALLLLAGLAAGCGASAQQRPQACQAVGAALSDGPDPGADPVGYAEAQVDPLKEIKTHDEALQRAIDQLANAYRRYYVEQGSQSAKRSIARAIRAVDGICPGTAS